MKTLWRITMLLATTILVAGLAFSAEDQKPFEKQHSDHIKEIFEAWDADRGPWLYESIGALVMQEDMPERLANQERTPFELVSEMSENRKNRILRAADVALEEERAQRTSDQYFWEAYMRFINSTDCQVSQGRSNGDPHMQTYDGEKYDFQTAGEYVLTSSTVNNFDVQTRQVRHNEKISVNGAVVVNVNGDRVSIYAQDFPDEFTDAPMRVNGMVVDENFESYLLDEGGVVRFTNDRYTIHAPTGEQVHVRTRTFQESALLDLDIFIPACDGVMEGLLGNADGNPETDLVVREPIDDRQAATDFPVDRTFEAVFGAGRNDQAQRNSEIARLNFLSRDFGNQFMVDSTNSMFEAPIGILPEALRYPSENLTLSDLNDEEIEEALAVCREAGVAEEDLMECAFDYGYVGLDPELPSVYVAPNEPREIGLPENNVNNPNDNKEQRNSTIRRGVGIGVGGGTINQRRRTAPTTTRPSRTNSGGGGTTRNPRTGGNR